MLCSKCKWLQEDTIQMRCCSELICSSCLDAYCKTTNSLCCLFCSCVVSIQILKKIISLHKNQKLLNRLICYKNIFLIDKEVILELNLNKLRMLYKLIDVPFNKKGYILNKNGILHMLCNKCNTLQLITNIKDNKYIVEYQCLNCRNTMKCVNAIDYENKIVQNYIIVNDIIRNTIVSNRITWKIKCIYCNRYHNVSKNVYCCGKYQCLQCEYTDNIKINTKHSCIRYRPRCPSCRDPVNVSTHQTPVTCACGERFNKYNNLIYKICKGKDVYLDLESREIDNFNIINKIFYIVANYKIE